MDWQAAPPFSPVMRIPTVKDEPEPVIVPEELVARLSSFRKWELNCLIYALTHRYTKNCHGSNHAKPTSLAEADERVTCQKRWKLMEERQPLESKDRLSTLKPKLLILCDRVKRLKTKYARKREAEYSARITGLSLRVAQRTFLNLGKKVASLRN